jgi:hypothetical protein
MELSDQADDALLSLLTELAGTGYEFVAVTPETHGRIISRAARAQAKDLRDIFGWCLPFSEATIPRRMFELLEAADAIEREGELYRSKLRVASLGNRLFLHSAFPTDERDSVFFGPDSYRFASFLREELPGAGSVRRLIDIGTGSGVGAIIAAPMLDRAQIVATDINPRALRLAQINARHAKVQIEFVQANGIGDVPGPVDLVIANPPYIADENSRAYRDGGDMHGARLSLDWALAAAARLEPGGRMLLYSGSAIVSGGDPLRASLEDSLPPLDCSLEYRELDPDVFGEELSGRAYADVERIAVVGAVIKKRARCDGRNALQDQALGSLGD